MKYIKASSLKPYHEHSGHIIKAGSKIKLYGEEKTVLGFYGCYNEGLERWETIILTDKRGDPFERSIDVIEIPIEAESAEVIGSILLDCTPDNKIKNEPA